MKEVQHAAVEVEVGAARRGRMISRRRRGDTQHNTERSRHAGLAAVMVIEERLALVVGVFAPGLRQLDPRQLVGDPPVLRPLVVIVRQEPQVDALLKHLGGYLRGVKVGRGRVRFPTPRGYGLAGIAVSCNVDMYIEPSSLELNSTL